jgi:2,3-bisphosphoglycerate-independent phosphoglycerate mutase
MIGWVFDNLPEDALLVILSDHTTCTELGEHTADPPPLMISGQSIFHDEVQLFTEREARKGMLNRIRGNDIIPILLDYMDKTKKFGA